ncbi:TetR/AcrR family transcriptional regulator [Streptomyces sp. NPDC047315]|uniref:TetR/AcrR family transcriptional regulator n=1 Tax=Streptomyces sp. NPDC047315 TaxID=3155142 RepID=UPI0033D02E6C
MANATGRAERPARPSVWLDSGKPERVRRSGQPSSLDRTKIVEAAVRLLDAEGAAKFSMRRLAAELDVTAMSVYWYVDTKDDLLEYALDHVFDSMRLPDVSDPEQWREQVRTLAVEYRGLLVRHPWVSPLVGHFLNIGPRSLTFAATAQKAIAHSGLPEERQTAGIASVFQFVYGFGTIEGHYVERCSSAGMTQDEYFQLSMGAFNTQPNFSDYLDNSVRIMNARGGGTVAEMRDRDFEYALDLLIIGIETLAARTAQGARG